MKIIRLFFTAISLMLFLTAYIDKQEKLDKELKNLSAPIKEEINQQKKLDREIEKLLGPVKMMEEQTSFVDFEDGKIVESEKFFVKYISFDQIGKKLDEKSTWKCGNSLFENKESIKDKNGNIRETRHYNYKGDSKITWFKITYSYDDEGKCIHQAHFNSEGKLYREWKYVYEYDGYGNWVKQTSFIKDKKYCNGNTYVPRQVSHRKIQYYE